MPQIQTKQEQTGLRSTKYSQWHRQLGPKYYAIDLDFIEYRANKGIVAIIAVTGNLKNKNHIAHAKPFIWKRTSLERKIMQEISQKLKVNAYYVIHTENLDYFEVFDLSYPLLDPMELTEKEYADFLKGLGETSKQQLSDFI